LGYSLSFIIEQYLVKQDGFIGLSHFKQTERSTPINVMPHLVQERVQPCTLL